MAQHPREDTPQASKVEFCGGFRAASGLQAHASERRNCANPERIETRFAVRLGWLLLD